MQPFSRIVTMVGAVDFSPQTSLIAFELHFFSFIDVNYSFIDSSLIMPPIGITIGDFFFFSMRIHII